MTFFKRLLSNITGPLMVIAFALFMQQLALMIKSFPAEIMQKTPVVKSIMLKIEKDAWAKNITQELFHERFIKNPTMQDLEAFLIEKPGTASHHIAKLHARKRLTLFSDYFVPYHLHYAIEKGELNFSTNPYYDYFKPVCASKQNHSLDFTIAAAVNFGLRGFIFSDQNCDEWEVGDYNTAYFDVAVSPDQSMMAFSVRGQYLIELYSLPGRRKLFDIRGYAASSLTFWKGDLYFAAAKRRSGDKASLYQYSLSERRVKAVFFKNSLADARGIAFRDDARGAISDSSSSRVILFDPSDKFRPTHILYGFNYPNNISFDAEGNLLVADEHHNLVRKISMQDFNELWYSPPGQLTSPSSAVEISKGHYKGHYLIADADANRIMVVEPASWDIVFEAGNIASPMSAVPIFDE